MYLLFRLIYQVTEWGRVLHDLKVDQLVEKFSAFYEILKLITVSTAFCPKS
jgi:hypothetical protein